MRVVGCMGRVRGRKERKQCVLNLRDKIVLKVKQNTVFISVCKCVCYVITHVGQKSVYNPQSLSYRWL